MRTARLYLAAKALSLCLMASPAYAALIDAGPPMSAHAVTAAGRSA